MCSDESAVMNHEEMKAMFIYWYDDMMKSRKL